MKNEPGQQSRKKKKKDKEEEQEQLVLATETVAKKKKKKKVSKKKDGDILGLEKKREKGVEPMVQISCINTFSTYDSFYYTNRCFRILIYTHI